MADGLSGSVVGAGVNSGDAGSVSMLRVAVVAGVVQTGESGAVDDDSCALTESRVGVSRGTVSTGAWLKHPMVFIN